MWAVALRGPRFARPPQGDGSTDEATQMTIFLDEAAVTQLVGMTDALEATEEVFREAGRGNVTNVPRVRVPLNDGTLRITAAVLNYRGYDGVKVSRTTVFG